MLLCFALLRNHPRRQFTKFYGASDDSEAKGIVGSTADWTEIADLLERYINIHGPIQTWIEWSTSNCDYKSFLKGLKSVGKAHLLPSPSAFPLMSPLMWWRAARRALGLNNLKLNLGNFYSILFPEDSELLSRQHWADADVLMLERLVGYTFNWAQGIPTRGKIESYYPRRSEPLSHDLKTMIDELQAEDDGDDYEDEEESEFDDGFDDYVDDTFEFDVDTMVDEEQGSDDEYLSY